MLITVDDVVSKKPIAGETGITTTYFEGRIDPQTRVLTLKFAQKKVAILDDGNQFEAPIPEELVVVLDDKIGAIPLLDRKNGEPTGEEMKAEALTNGLMSLYVMVHSNLEARKLDVATKTSVNADGHDG